jgi:hypothetical protein
MAEAFYRTGDIEKHGSGLIPIRKQITASIKPVVPKASKHYRSKTTKKRAAANPMNCSSKKNYFRKAT